MLSGDNSFLNDALERRHLFAGLVNETRH